MSSLHNCGVLKETVSFLSDHKEIISELGLRSKSTQFNRQYRRHHRSSSRVQENVSTDTFLGMDSFKMNYLYSSLFATVLEDTVTQLRILSECNSGLRIMKTMTELDHLRSMKFAIQQPHDVDELAGIDQKNLGKEVYKLDKLSSDRKFVLETLIITYLDLSVKRSFQVLQQQIKIILDRKLFEQAQLIEEAKNRLLRQDLARQLRVQRNHMKSATYDITVIIEDLTAQIEDATMNSEIRTRYIDKWQRARTEQNDVLINTAEEPVLVEIMNAKTKGDNEQRVHEEVMSLMHMNIDETMDETEKLMAKYDSDMEVIDLKIEISRIKYEDAAEDARNLEKVYTKHEKESKIWQDFKRERAEKIEYRIKMNNAAITAQAWWRGILVRQHLGPYKLTRQELKKAKKEKK